MGGDSAVSFLDEESDMRLEDFHGPTINDFPGLFGTRLLVLVVLAAMIIQLALTVGLVWMALQRRRKEVDSGRAAAAVDHG